MATPGGDLFETWGAREIVCRNLGYLREAVIYFLADFAR